MQASKISLSVCSLKLSPQSHGCGISHNIINTCMLCERAIDVSTTILTPTIIFNTIKTSRKYTHKWNVQSSDCNDVWIDFMPLWDWLDAEGLRMRCGGRRQRFCDCQNAVLVHRGRSRPILNANLETARELSPVSEAGVNWIKIYYQRDSFRIFF